MDNCVSVQENEVCFDNIQKVLPWKLNTHISFCIFNCHADANDGTPGDLLIPR